MSNLSQKDKHSPVVQTGQPNIEQTVPAETTPAHHDHTSIKKELNNKDQEDNKKTGDR